MLHALKPIDIQGFGDLCHLSWRARAPLQPTRSMTKMDSNGPKLFHRVGNRVDLAAMRFLIIRTSTR